jgi:hypothetical protein
LAGKRKRKKTRRTNAEFAGALSSLRRIGFNTEDTEEEHRGHGEEENQEKSRKAVALDRKNPPFAKGAKDGAPSSSFVRELTTKY